MRDDYPASGSPSRPGQPEVQGEREAPSAPSARQELQRTQEPVLFLRIGAPYGAAGIVLIGFIGGGELVFAALEWVPGKQEWTLGEIMRLRGAQIFAGLAVLAAAVGLMVGLWLYRTEPNEAASHPASAASPSTRRPAVAGGATGKPRASKRRHAHAGAALQAPFRATAAPEPVELPQSKGPRAPVPPSEEADSWEFTQADLDAAVGRTVKVELGRCTVAVGGTVEVEVTLDAPPLQAVVVAMRYDQSLLEPVPGSAFSMGPVFRKGVEFFIDPAHGRMALFCATYPGKKNVLAAHHEVVARFAVRGKAVGTAHILADSQGMKCVAGNGALLPVDFVPGVVVVRPAR